MFNVNARQLSSVKNCLLPPIIILQLLSGLWQDLTSGPETAWLPSSGLEKQHHQTKIITLTPLSLLLLKLIKIVVCFV